MPAHDSSKTYTFPAGTYWIGDPCYAIKDWDKVGKETGWFGADDTPEADNFAGAFTYRNQRCFAYGTAYGDGEYQGSDHFSYGVDAGLLGILPEAALDGDSIQLGHRVHFPEEFTVRCIDGRFTFGHITINTADDEDED